MNSLNILWLRFRKVWSSFLWRHIYPDLPFEIAYADVSNGYEYDERMKVRLAEFDKDGKHYVVYSLR